MRFVNNSFQLLIRRVVFLGVHRDATNGRKIDTIPNEKNSTYDYHPPNSQQRRTIKNRLLL